MFLISVIRIHVVFWIRIQIQVRNIHTITTKSPKHYSFYSILKNLYGRDKYLKRKCTGTCFLQFSLAETIWISVSLLIRRRRNMFLISS